MIDKNFIGWNHHNSVALLNIAELSIVELCFFHKTRCFTKHKIYWKKCRLFASSCPRFERREFCFFRSMSPNIWCTVAFSLNSTFTELVHILWFDDADCESLFRLVTMFLSMVHSASRTSIFFSAAFTFLGTTSPL